MNQMEAFHAQADEMKARYEEMHEEAKGLRRQLMESNVEVERLKSHVATLEREAGNASNARLDETEGLRRELNEFNQEIERLKSRGLALERDFGFRAPEPLQALTNARRSEQEQYYRNKAMLEHFEAHVSEQLAAAERASPQHYADMVAKYGSDFSVLSDFMWQFFAKKIWPQDDTSGHECVVCANLFEAGEFVVTLPCAHIFHNDCVKPWFNNNDSCPLCSALTVPTRASIGSMSP